MRCDALFEFSAAAACSSRPSSFGFTSTLQLELPSNVVHGFTISLCIARYLLGSRTKLAVNMIVSNSPVGVGRCACFVLRSVEAARSVFFFACRLLKWCKLSIFHHSVCAARARPAGRDLRSRVASTGTTKKVEHAPRFS